VNLYPSARSRLRNCDVGSVAAAVDGRSPRICRDFWPLWCCPTRPAGGPALPGSAAKPCSPRVSPTARIRPSPSLALAPTPATPHTASCDRWVKAHPGPETLHLAIARPSSKTQTIATRSEKRRGPEGKRRQAPQLRGCPVGADRQTDRRTMNRPSIHETAAPRPRGRVMLQRASRCDRKGSRLRAGIPCVPCVPPGAAGAPGWIPWAGLNFSRLASSPDPTPVVVTWGRESCRDSTPIVLSGENDATWMGRALSRWTDSQPGVKLHTVRGARVEARPSLPFTTARSIYISQTRLLDSSVLFPIPIPISHHIFSSSPSL
jgi:hypothetical protein